MPEESCLDCIHWGRRWEDPCTRDDTTPRRSPGWHRWRKGAEWHMHSFLSVSSMQAPLTSSEKLLLLGFPTTIGSALELWVKNETSSLKALLSEYFITTSKTETVTICNRVPQTLVGSETLAYLTPWWLRVSCQAIKLSKQRTNLLKSVQFWECLRHTNLAF